ncbi:hypothetical protein DdX_12846 [Ditylenchus destructor]|uniref:Uncharacterized protein n=1 Tax=Ditylenchus destructor TaxID=166010 RepID=A0AAD4MXR8_9BILA|nr:hypothetical protein DdX_12846 [Ditylenchus destructor]
MMMFRITLALLVLLGITVKSVYAADTNPDLNIVRALKGDVDLELNSTDIIAQINETGAAIDPSNGTFTPSPLINGSKSSVDVISTVSLRPSSASSLAPSSVLTSSQRPSTLKILPVPEDDCPKTCRRPFVLLYFIFAECQYEKKTTPKPGLEDVTNVSEQGKCVRYLNFWVFFLLFLFPLLLIGVFIAYFFRVVKPQIGNGRTFRWCYV